MQESPTDAEENLQLKELSSRNKMDDTSRQSNTASLDYSAPKLGLPASQHKRVWSSSTDSSALECKLEALSQKVKKNKKEASVWAELQEVKQLLSQREIEIHQLQLMASSRNHSAELPSNWLDMSSIESPRGLTTNKLLQEIDECSFFRDLPAAETVACPPSLGVYGEVRKRVFGSIRSRRTPSHGGPLSVRAQRGQF